MGARGRLRVAVIYKHPLLGEGIGRMLAAEPDMAVRQALCDDAVRTAAVVSAEPDVVVLERNCTLEPDRYPAQLARHAGDRDQPARRRHLGIPAPGDPEPPGSRHRPRSPSPDRPSGRYVGE